MKPYRYAMSLTSQFFFCGVPFRLDTTPKCSINCAYCFAMARGGRRTSGSMIADPNRILAKLETATLHPQAVQDVNGQMLIHRVPLHFGGMSDPFSTRVASSVSRQLLEGLARYDYPVVLSTKNTVELTKPETLAILSKLRNIVIQVSLTSPSSNIARILEPSAPPPQKRLDALKTLATLGIFTVVRLQPLFPQFMDEIIEYLVPAMSAVGVKHVIVEFIKLPVERNLADIRRVCTSLNWDGYGFMQSNGAKLVGREWILPNEYKWEKVQLLRHAIGEFGMTYGAADYGLNHLGDTACCCGIDNLKGFSNWFQGNYASAIRQAPVGELRIQQILSQWYPGGTIRAILNSQCRYDGVDTLADYLRAKWNRPGTANAPDHLFGVTWTGEVDNNNDCVYHKNVVQ